MKKILLLIDSLGSGGAQRQIVTLAEILKEKNFNISLLIYYRDDFFVDRLIKLQIPINYIGNKLLIRAFKVRKFIRNGNFDVVISFMETPNLLNNIAAIGGKTWKVITCERSAKVNTFTSWRGKFFSIFQHYSDCLVCNSQNSKSMWEMYYPKYKDKLKVVYNPVILPDITSQYLPKRNGKINIVVAASYQYLKNPIGLVSALALMSENERDKIKIDWYGQIKVSNGNTKAYDEAIRLINENNLHNVIHLNEAIKDIADKMNEADFVALFSELEGMPNAICESMMIGKPIIMSKVSDYKELIDGTNGFLCDWDNPESIKKALNQTVCLNETELFKMGESSRNKAQKLFMKKEIIKSWLNIILNDV